MNQNFYLNESLVIFGGIDNDENIILLCQASGLQLERIELDECVRATISRTDDAFHIRSQKISGIIDVRNGRWEEAKHLLELFETKYLKRIHRVLLLRPETFWQKQRAALSIGKYRFDVQSITVSQLNRFVHLSQLPEVVGGECKIFNYGKWMNEERRIFQWKQQSKNLLKDCADLQKEIYSSHSTINIHDYINVDVQQLPLLPDIHSSSTTKCLHSPSINNENGETNSSRTFIDSQMNVNSIPSDIDIALRSLEIHDKIHEVTCLQHIFPLIDQLIQSGIYIHYSLSNYYRQLYSPISHLINNNKQQQQQHESMNDNENNGKQSNGNNDVNDEKILQSHRKSSQQQQQQQQHHHHHQIIEEFNMDSVSCLNLQVNQIKQSSNINGHICPNQTTNEGRKLEEEKHHQNQILATTELYDPLLHLSKVTRLIEQLRRAHAEIQSVWKDGRRLLADFVCLRRLERQLHSVQFRFRRYFQQLSANFDVVGTNIQQTSQLFDELHYHSQHELATLDGDIKRLIRQANDLIGNYSSEQPPIGGHYSPNNNQLLTLAIQHLSEHMNLTRLEWEYFINSLVCRRRLMLQSTRKFHKKATMYIEKVGQWKEDCMIKENESLTTSLKELISLCPSPSNSMEEYEMNLLDELPSDLNRLHDMLRLHYSLSDHISQIYTDICNEGKQLLEILHDPIDKEIEDEEIALKFLADNSFYFASNHSIDSGDTTLSSHYSVASLLCWKEKEQKLNDLIDISIIFQSLFLKLRQLNHNNNNNKNNSIQIALMNTQIISALTPSHHQPFDELSNKQSCASSSSPSSSGIGRTSILQIPSCSSSTSSTTANGNSSGVRDNEKLNENFNETYDELMSLRRKRFRQSAMFILNVVHEILEHHRTLEELWQRKRLVLVQKICIIMYSIDVEQILEWLTKHGEGFLEKYSNYGSNVDEARQLQQVHIEFEQVLKATIHNTDKLLQSAREFPISGTIFKPSKCDESSKTMNDSNDYETINQIDDSINKITNNVENQKNISQYHQQADLEKLMLTSSWTTINMNIDYLNNISLSSSPFHTSGNSQQHLEKNHQKFHHHQYHHHHQQQQQQNYISPKSSRPNSSVFSQSQFSTTPKNCFISTSTSPITTTTTTTTTIVSSSSSSSLSNIQSLMNTNGNDNFSTIINTTTTTTTTTTTSNEKKNGGSFIQKNENSNVFNFAVRIIEKKANELRELIRSFIFKVDRRHQSLTLSLTYHTHSQELHSWLNDLDDLQFPQLDVTVLDVDVAKELFELFLHDMNEINDGFSRTIEEGHSFIQMISDTTNDECTLEKIRYDLKQLQLAYYILQPSLKLKLSRIQLILLIRELEMSITKLLTNFFTWNDCLNSLSYQQQQQQQRQTEKTTTDFLAHCERKLMGEKNSEILQHLSLIENEIKKMMLNIFMASSTVMSHINTIVSTIIFIVSFNEEELLNDIESKRKFPLKFVFHRFREPLEQLLKLKNNSFQSRHENTNNNNNNNDESHHLYRHSVISDADSSISISSNEYEKMKIPSTSPSSSSSSSSSTTTTTTTTTNDSLPPNGKNYILTITTNSSMTENVTTTMKTIDNQLLSNISNQKPSEPSPHHHSMNNDSMLSSPIDKYLFTINDDMSLWNSFRSKISLNFLLLNDPLNLLKDGQLLNSSMIQSIDLERLTIIRSSIRLPISLSAYNWLYTHMKKDSNNLLKIPIFHRQQQQQQQQQQNYQISNQDLQSKFHYQSRRLSWKDMAAHIYVKEVIHRLQKEEERLNRLTRSHRLHLEYSICVEQMMNEKVTIDQWLLTTKNQLVYQFPRTIDESRRFFNDNLPLLNELKRLKHLLHSMQTRLNHLYFAYCQQQQHLKTDFTCQHEQMRREKCLLEEELVELGRQWQIIYHLIDDRYKMFEATTQFYLSLEEIELKCFQKINESMNQNHFDWYHHINEEAKKSLLNRLSDNQNHQDNESVEKEKLLNEYLDELKEEKETIRNKFHFIKRLSDTCLRYIERVTLNITTLNLSERKLLSSKWTQSIDDECLKLKKIEDDLSILWNRKMHSLRDLLHLVVYDSAAQQIMHWTEQQENEYFSSKQLTMLVATLNKQKKIDELADNEKTNHEKSLQNLRRHLVELKCKIFEQTNVVKELRQISDSIEHNLKYNQQQQQQQPPPHLYGRHICELSDMLLKSYRAFLSRFHNYGQRINSILFEYDDDNPSSSDQNDEDINNIINLLSRSPITTTTTTTIATTTNNTSVSTSTSNGISTENDQSKNFNTSSSTIVSSIIQSTTMNNGNVEKWKKMEETFNESVDGQTELISNKKVCQYLFTCEHPENERLNRRREMIFKELLTTEEIYVKDLRTCLDYYCANYRSASNGDHQNGKGKMENVMKSLPSLPPYLLNKDKEIFSNLQEIYDFHQKTFLQELHKYSKFPEDVGHCFVTWSHNFRMYVEYCRTKTESMSLIQANHQLNDFFLSLQHNFELNDSISSMLIKPVQRITKYQLLLRELLNTCRVNVGKSLKCSSLPKPSILSISSQSTTTNSNTLSNQFNSITNTTTTTTTTTTSALTPFSMKSKLTTTDMIISKLRHVASAAGGGSGGGSGNGSSTSTTGTLQSTTLNNLNQSNIGEDENNQETFIGTEIEEGLKVMMDVPRKANDAIHFSYLTHFDQYLIREMLHDVILQEAFVIWETTNNYSMNHSKSTNKYKYSSQQSNSSNTSIINQEKFENRSKEDEQQQQQQQHTYNNPKTTSTRIPSILLPKRTKERRLFLFDSCLIIAKEVREKDLPIHDLSLDDGNTSNNRHSSNDHNSSISSISSSSTTIPNHNNTTINNNNNSSSSNQMNWTNNSEPISSKSQQLRYVYKYHLLTQDLGITEHIEGGDKCKFAIWAPYTKPNSLDYRCVIKASTIDIKFQWIRALRNIINRSLLTNTTMADGTTFNSSSSSFGTNINNKSSSTTTTTTTIIDEQMKYRQSAPIQKFAHDQKQSKLSKEAIMIDMRKEDISITKQISYNSYNMKRLISKPLSTTTPFRTESLLTSSTNLILTHDIKSSIEPPTVLTTTANNSIPNTSAATISTK
ncbi:hypothetical protein SNEBB_008408 [Seison nebaliae]|nr:hypothetical protein SNEBB_008408 [Seison nebaliae]